MIRFDSFCSLAAHPLFVVLLLGVPGYAQQPGSIRAEGTRLSSAKTSPPIPPAPKPPVDLFRSLLTMTPQERREFLAKRSPEAQKLILAKIHEYEGLTPEMRELRLRVTELRWYLLPLLNTAAADRASRLNTVPAALRELVETRLNEWDKLNPEIQKQFLENESTLRFYFELAARTPAQLGERATNTISHEALQEGIQRWQALTDEQRQDVVHHFRQFLDLTPVEKEKTLRTLSGVERAQIEKTLDTFRGLTPSQRVQCVHSFAKFASFSPEERQQFLQNADRWERMSPTDRQALRNLVSNLQNLPPLPPGLGLPPVPAARVPRALDPPRGSLWTTNTN